MPLSKAVPFSKTGTQSAAPRPLPPWLEQILLFGLFAAAALFWIAVIWWIVR
jgi:hypothetical protein